MPKKRKKTVSRKKLYVWIGVVLVVLALGGYVSKKYIFDSFSEKSFIVYVYPNTTFDELIASLRKEVDAGEVERFKKMASLQGYVPSEKPGAYQIDKHMSAFQVFSKLVGGMQTPVRFTFNNLRTKEQLADRIGEQLMMERDSIYKLLNDSVMCAKLGFNEYTIPAMFVPDTYEIYWTISPEKFMERMKKESDLYWNEGRLLKAREAGLTPVQVSILASIVEEETNVKDEMNMVAGLYLNRLRINMLLQADPTVKFAVQDFSIKRVLLTHLQSNSPYNTYKFIGLPPGPIRIPSKRAIEAVLNFDEHNYIYMCAKEDFSGRHNFARTLDEHTQNAVRYHRALSKRNIYK